MERLELSAGAQRFMRSARVGHLATADKSGQPHVIPICFVFDGKKIFSPIDEKPKRTTNLKRLKNIAENPNVALVVDHYEENWRNLAYLLFFGKARVLRSGRTHRRVVGLLRRKYPQYRRMALEDRPLIVITPTKMTPWAMSG